MAKRSFKKILIANRGEIAVRVIRACRELGISSVAVFSDADRTALHVRMADEAQHLGPPPARESYLDIEKILAACRRSGAEAVHPGYGFLSENEEFAEACERAGIVFIGPPAEAMRKMGDKTSARATVSQAGVPVVPGDNGPDGRGFPTSQAALEAARRVGFPVMLKAAAGGGGKGMRLCAQEKGFEAAYAGARREALAAFGDDAVYLEKAIVGPRHVEVQVFADLHGNVVHLGERDCSVQRRHQKVIEESPSPAVDEALRAQMGAMAVAAARACGYVGAGTIECLLDPRTRHFYFLEMNTRLQVEHPVTEMVTGLDLVRLQIQVAQGEPLGFGQDDVKRRGHAIEFRIYAEDPIRFLPSPGTITHLRRPGGPFVRDDSGVTAPAVITPYYDPLISKLVVWGETREAALARGASALAEYRVRGIKTNLAFHRRVLANAAFQRGDYDTGFIERYQAELLHASPPPPALVDVALAVAALHASQEERAGAVLKLETPATGSGWRATPGWRSGR
jgi:acetyl-CoA carboxylase biotin carboxylase subunit